MRKKQTPWKRKIGTLSITILTSRKKKKTNKPYLRKFLTQICLWSLFTSVLLFPLHLVFIFVRTLSHCSINEGESNLWRKIDDRNRIFSSLSFSKPKVPAVLPLANSLSENNTSTQAMAVVDIWEPNTTMASTFFCCSSVGPGCGFCSCWF